MQMGVRTMSTEGGFWHDAFGVTISSAAGGAYWPIAIRCLPLDPLTPSAVVPIGFSPPCDLPLPPCPNCPSPLPFPPQRRGGGGGPQWC